MYDIFVGFDTIANFQAEDSHLCVDIAEGSAASAEARPRRTFRTGVLTHENIPAWLNEAVSLEGEKLLTDMLAYARVKPQSLTSRELDIQTARPLVRFFAMSQASDNS